MVCEKRPKSAVSISVGVGIRQLGSLFQGWYSYHCSHVLDLTKGTTVEYLGSKISQNFCKACSIGFNQESPFWYVLYSMASTKA